MAAMNSYKINSILKMAELFSCKAPLRYRSTPSPNGRLTTPSIVDRVTRPAT